MEKEIDLMIHMGMNSGAEEAEYALETKGRRDGYKKVDENGEYLPSNAFKGMPEELRVGFDVEDITTKMRESLPVSRRERKTLQGRKLKGS